MLSILPDASTASANRSADAATREPAADSAKAPAKDSDATTSLKDLSAAAAIKDSAGTTSLRGAAAKTSPIQGPVAATKTVRMGLNATPSEMVKSAIKEPEPASKAPETAKTAVDEAATEPDAPHDFEIVLGRRQVASVLFVATVLGAVICAGSFLAGKSLTANKSEAQSAAAVAKTDAPAAPPPLIEATVEPDIAAAEAKAGVSSKTPAPSKPIVSMEADGDPLFAEPKPGATYLQMAAVDRGVAAVFVEGLRARGFPSFVAPGPSETMFRVLIGPMADSADYSRTKQALVDIGLATFGRKYDGRTENRTDSAARKEQGAASRTESKASKDQATRANSQGSGAQ